MEEVNPEIIHIEEEITPELILRNRNETPSSFSKRLRRDYRVHTLDELGHTTDIARYIAAALGRQGNLSILDLGCGEGLQTGIFVDIVTDGSLDAKLTPLDFPGNYNRRGKLKYILNYPEEVGRKLEEVKDYIERMAKLRKEMNINVHGVEACKEMVVAAAETGMYTSLTHGLFHEIGHIRDNSMDAAVCFSATFGHELDKDTARRALEECKRVVVNGGYIFIDNLYGQDNISFTRTWELNGEKDTTRIKRYSMQGLRELTAGLGRLEFYVTDLDTHKRIENDGQEIKKADPNEEYLVTNKITVQK